MSLARKLVSLSFFIFLLGALFIANLRESASAFSNLDLCIRKYVQEGVSFEEAREKCEELIKTKEDDIIFCPQDVRRCPDGSYVKRVPPTCEFEPCPSERVKEVPNQVLPRERWERPEPGLTPPSQESGVCEKARALERTLEMIEKDIETLKDIEQTEEVERKLVSLLKEREFLRARLEKAKSACEKGEKVGQKERPCTRAAELELLYESLKESLQKAPSSREALEIQEKMRDVAQEIRELKAECARTKLEEEVEIKEEEGGREVKLSEIEKALGVKIKALLEEPTSQLEKELEAVEREAQKTLADLLRSVDTLDISGSSLIKEIKIKGKGVTIEGESVPIKKIKMKLEGERGEVASDLEIDLSQDIPKVKEGGIEASLEVEVELKDSDGDGLRELVHSATGQRITITPAKIKEKIQEILVNPEIRDIRLTEVKGERGVIYEVKAVKRAKLLGFLPLEVKISHTAQIDAISGQLRSLHKPWWSFLFR